ncbi:MAG: hypothetical protein QXR48_04890 [Candidatus Woesearchaeota archaeon]
MVDNAIATGIDALVKESVNLLGNNLQAIILFGSGNNSDFVKGISDLDFIYVVESIDYRAIEQIRKLKEMGMKITNCAVDIKPFTREEFTAGINGKSACEFFTGWGLEMIRRGNQRCLYRTKRVSLEYTLSEERIRADALPRAHYYITKLRKIYLGENPKIFPFNSDSITPLLKVTASAVKNILAFGLAYKGVIADGIEQVLEESKKHFGDVEVFRQLFEAKKKRDCDSKLLVLSYEAIERVYQRMLHHG